MLYNIKAVYLHCVFHGIRFKVNEDWVSVIDTLLFFCTYITFTTYNNLQTLHSIIFLFVVIIYPPQ